MNSRLFCGVAFYPFCFNLIASRPFSIRFLGKLDFHTVKKEALTEWVFSSSPFVCLWLEAAQKGEEAADVSEV